MKKVFKLENLDCAHCAEKMEKGINDIEGVNKCVISFMTQKLSIDMIDEKADDIIADSEKIIKKIDRHCKIVK